MQAGLSVEALIVQRSLIGPLNSKMIFVKNKHLMKDGRGEPRRKWFIHILVVHPYSKKDLSDMKALDRSILDIGGNQNCIPQPQGLCV